MKLFETYTQQDEQLVKDCSKFDLYLIGGTAIDYWCRRYGIKPVRHRSNNDIDFYTSSNNKYLKQAISFLEQNYGFVFDKDSVMLSGTNRDKTIEIDILIDYAKQPSICFSKTDIAVMTPLYLFTSKFSRYFNCSNKKRREIDEQDLLQLIAIIDKRGTTEDFERYLQSQHFGLVEETVINNLINQYLNLK